MVASFYSLLAIRYSLLHRNAPRQTIKFSLTRWRRGTRWRATEDNPMPVHCKLKSVLFDDVGADGTGSLQLAARIRPLLAGHPSMVQGAAMADLVSIWIAGYPPDERAAMLALFISAVTWMIEPSAAQLLEDSGVPSGARRH
jgi:hypothetical protein